jgi:sarcosine oxidase
MSQAPRAAGETAEAPSKRKSVNEAFSPRGSARRLTKADVIVVGLGAMGSATCFQLAARGVSVIGIDQYEPPHAYGSTHGDTRITRLAIGEGPEYVPLVRRSHDLWREIEQEAGVQLLTRSGGLVLAHAASPFLRQTLASARQFEIVHENLSNAEIVDRFPMFLVDQQTEAYFEPEAGYVRPEAAVRAQLELARRHGAQLQLGEHVEAWAASAGGVIVRTDTDTYEAQQLVLCAGAWIPQLFPEGSEIFAIHRQLLYWFPIREGYERLRGMPTFIWDVGGETQGFVHLHGFYGFPAVDGREGGVKVAAESYEQTTTPDGRQHPATQPEIDDMYERCIKPHLPWLGAEPVRTRSCLYTSTRGSRFVIDRHPEHDPVVIVSPCSGHGFKHSPAIGEAVAQWVIGRASDVDLSPFGLSQARR